MGAGQSIASEDHPPSRALHVLRVTPSSPASQTSIEPFFDFVVGYEGDNLSGKGNVDAAELERIVESHEERVLNLLVWNSKNKSTRVVPITPSRSWSLSQADASNSQRSDPDTQPSLLGLSMRMCEPEFSLENVWHVLDVLEGSPAESAGLVPYGDWIIGYSGGILGAESDFYDVVEDHIDRPLRVYVYSYDFDTLREVVLVPNRHWGGSGLLGCVFGFGLLHRIPPQEPGRQPGSLYTEDEGQQDDEYEEQQLFVPAFAQNYDRGTHEPHGHESTHDNGQDPDYMSDASPSRTAQDTRIRTSSWASHAMPTPQRTTSVGVLANGASLARLDALLSPTRTPVPGDVPRTLGRDFTDGRSFRPPSLSPRGYDDDGNSYLGTDTTDTRSERTSSESLTSVD